jgi:hypothetical protein
MKDLLEKFVIIAKDTENVDASKYRAFKLKQRLMKSYPQPVFCVPKMRNVSQEVYWSFFLLRLQKFFRPEYRRERFVK